MRPEQDRGLSTCTSTQSELHLFGSYGDPADPSTWPQWTQTVDTTWGASSGEPRLWLVAARGWGRQRVGAAPLSPLSRAQVSESSGSWSPRPMSKIAVAVGDMATARQPLIIDGDQSIEVYGATISVAALVPAGTQNVASPRTAALEVSAGDLAVDDLLGCRVLGIQSPVGARDAVLTGHLYAPPNTAASVQIPRGAVEVSVSPAQPDAGAWEWRVGDPSASPPLAATALVGTFSSTHTPVRVPSATHLSVVADAAARLFSLTWKVRA